MIFYSQEMIRIENLSKSFGARSLFDEASFSVNRKERIGLVGRNGHGKTTLFKIILGEDHADEGSVIIPRDYTVGHVSQNLHFTGKTVSEEAALGLPEHREDEVWYAEKILSGLGFSQEDFLRAPGEFSGGYQIRLNLAKVLAAHPDLLLLDEPTNYLDLVAIRWLKDFIRTWPGEMLLITHDRSFMDSVCTHTVAIHRKKIRKIEGSTEKMYHQIIREEEIYEKTRLNDEKKKKEVELFISRFRAKARLAGLVQSRVKALEKKDQKNKLEKIETLGFAFNEAPFNTKTLLTAKGLTFGYQEKNPLFKDFSLTISYGDKICIIGKNGKGKSTLLAALAGELPLHQGEILMHNNTAPGLFSQSHTSPLSDNNTIEEELSQCGVEKETARNIAGTMMFEGDEALKKISILSGGEKSRVQMGKVLATPANLLFLDEPTNHLDMESSDSLLSAIDNFSGSVVLVTHNEMYLHALAEKLIVFQGDTPYIFQGTYQDFLDKTGWDEESEKKTPGKAKEKSPEEKINRKETRKLRSKLQTERNTILKSIVKKIEQVETSLHQEEMEKEELNNLCIEASAANDGSAIEKLSRELHKKDQELEALYSQYENLLEEQDNINQEYEKKLDNL